MDLRYNKYLGLNHNYTENNCITLIDSIYKNILSIKKDFLKKKLLKKNILDLLNLKKEFIKVSKINADYENPYFNLAKCYLKKKNYNK